MNKENFIYETLATRVVFGAGTVTKVREEVEALGAKRAVVISTPTKRNYPDQVAEIVGDLCVGVLKEAVQHVPVEVVEKSLEKITSLQADSLIAIGGGSAIGLAKALALKTGLPILAIPTTYAGSEMTPVWGKTENGIKTTGRNVLVKPKTVIYDPEFTVSLPTKLTVTSAMNALAHCVEGLYAENKNPIINLLAEEGIRSISNSIPKILEESTNLSYRSEALYGCWLGGTVLSSVGMALHHKLCHVLGGSFNLPHAETHTVILPYAIWYNASHIPEALSVMARALGTAEEDVASYLFDLSQSLGAPTSLEEIGMSESDLDTAAELATKNPYYNPRSIDKQGIRKLLEYAYIGEQPKKGSFSF